jgi:threonylcarbamoyladenosine tRNA methylthiotransferase CDKAL1
LTQNKRENGPGQNQNPSLWKRLDPKQKRKWARPESNWRPPLCESDVIATRPRARNVLKTEVLFINLMAKVYIESYGCTLNKADSQAIASILIDAGFEIVKSPEGSELIIVNTCTVKTPTETKIKRRLVELKQLNKPIIVAGCIPQATPEALKGFSLLGVFQLPRIVEVAEETLNGNTVVALAHEKYNRLAIPNYSPNPFIEILPICQGCLGSPCSYCLTKKARGELFSYRPEAILKSIDHAAKQGKKEIWLTAQDTAAYGLDINTNLAKLLKQAIQIKGDFSLRLGMGNPNHLMSLADELIELYSSKKLFRFLHAPVQAGSDEVLKRMRRKYTSAEFRQLISKFRKAFPDITIATDIICGFPGETKSQFEHSLELVEEIKPDVLNISRFWPRPGTEASKLRGYSGNKTKLRSRELTSRFRQMAFRRNLEWMGWQGQAIIDEPGSFGSWKGRNYAYKQIVVLSNDDLLGKKVNVKVVDATAYDLRCKLL